jgi:hypothetical protein
MIEREPVRLLERCLGPAVGSYCAWVSPVSLIFKQEPHSADPLVLLGQGESLGSESGQSTYHSFTEFRLQ